MIDRSQKATFKFIKDRIWRKINTWSSKHLSQAGREVMIKSILQSIMTYVMSVFLLPSTLIDEIEKMLNSFWWGHSGNDVRKLHWLSWERLSVSKDYGGMGFKNLQAFNMAMLGKHAWNLVSKPSSLITQLFKARYFPKCDFFESSIGHNPSYAWRSIWSSKFVFQRGCKWSIGTGDHISVWEQNWLKDGMSISKPTNFQNFGEIKKVKDLMMSNLKSWDLNIICGIFDNNTVRRIMQTPLFNSVRDGKLVWKLDSDGVYSVRSAYKYCINSAGNQDRHGVAGNWNQIWREKIPPKVKNLLWRIGRNVLPTCVRLNSRGVQCPTTCGACNNEEKDSMHVLFLCPRSVRCWQRVGLWVDVCAGLNANNNIVENLFSILHILNTEQQELFSVMVWSIWKSRNHQVWDNTSDSIQTVCERARHLITSWRNAQQVRSLANTPRLAFQETTWIKPSPGRFKCNVDASFSLAYNKVGIGMCIRDDQGRFVTARTKWLQLILDVEVGETVGLLSALKWVDELQLRDMDFELDCKRVVDSLHSNKTYLSDFGAIISDCRSMLATNLVNCHVKFIRRQANEVAHTLARAATSLASFHSFIDIPTCIYDIVMNEMR